MGHYNSISLQWLISNLRKVKHQKRKNTTRLQDRRNRKSSSKRNNHILSKDTTPPHSNIITKRYQKCFSALNVDHEIQARNYLPVADIKRGWVIDSGASAHMTP